MLTSAARRAAARPARTGAFPAPRARLQRTLQRTAATWKPDSDPDDMLSQECPVPLEQQPLYELKQLREDQLFEWANLDWPTFAFKLAQVYGGFFALIAMPVSVLTFDLEKETLQCLVSASVGSMFVVTVLVLRIYLGWQHVGARLLSATVEYEETGWYDGQVWVKTPQMLMRDRLQQMYTVKPAIQKLKQTLLGLGGALAASVVILAATPTPRASAGTPYSYSLSEAGSSGASAPLVRQEEDYEARLSQYEPWAMDEAAEEGAGAAASIRSHMLSSAEGVQYN